MTYKGSEAFCGRGTRTVFNGVEVPEVKHIIFGRAETQFEYSRPVVSVTMNYVWADKVQARLLGARQVQLDGVDERHDVELYLPMGRKVTIFGTRIESALVSVEVNDVVSLTVVFVHGRVEYSHDKHNVEDGPEVDVIKRERAIRDEEEVEIRRMIRRIFEAAAREEEIRAFETWKNIFTLGTDAYDFEDVDTPYPVGGGFTQVHDSHGYHYSPEKPIVDYPSPHDISTLPIQSWPVEYRVAYFKMLLTGKPFQL